MTAVLTGSPFTSETEGITFLELEITGKCNLACSHCYAESGPRGTHGSMTFDDWRSVITQAAESRSIKAVQFIGGEPTEHPDFKTLMTHALSTTLGVEVYSNLVHVTPELWELYCRPNAFLATSFYSDDPGKHDAITRRNGSHAATLMNIREAVRRGIVIRVGVVEQDEDQGAAEAAELLRAIGVDHVNLDRMRSIGRGERNGIRSVTELCGRCARNNLAISPDGEVWGCTLSRFLPSPGNVKTQSLTSILSGAALTRLQAAIPPRRADSCSPDDSAPSVCGPDVCGPSGQKMPALIGPKATQ